MGPSTIRSPSVREQALAYAMQWCEAVCKSHAVDSSDVLRVARAFENYLLYEDTKAKAVS